jgi:hypothetical protein
VTDTDNFIIISIYLSVIKQAKTLGSVDSVSDDRAKSSDEMCIKISVTLT